MSLILYLPWAFMAIRQQASDHHRSTAAFKMIKSKPSLPHKWSRKITQAAPLSRSHDHICSRIVLLMALSTAS